MKINKYLFFLIVLILPTNFLFAKTATLYDRLKGRILLQVEAKGQLWYVDPESGTKRVALSDANQAFDIFKADGISATNSVLDKIKPNLEFLNGPDKDSDGLPDDFEKSIGTDFTKSDTDGDSYNDKTEIANGYSPLGVGRFTYDSGVADKYKGWILIQKDSKNEMWYVDPVTNSRYFLNNPTTVAQVLKKVSLGITNANLNLIKQVAITIPKVTLADKNSAAELVKIQGALDSFANSINKQDIDLFLSSVGSSFSGSNYSKDDSEKVSQALEAYRKELGSKSISFKIMPELSERQYNNIYYVRTYVYLDNQDVTVNGAGQNSIVVKYENEVWKIIDMEVEFK